MNTDFNRVMLCLSIEVTRKCDMNCSFCSRGPAQNLNITHEVIDRTINEMKHFFACGLRLHGGEPLLAYEEIHYLFSKIIEYRIPISYIVVFTNGFIKDERYFNLVRMMLAYIREIEAEYPEVVNIKNHTEINEIYNVTSQKKIVFIASSYGHDNKPNYKDTLDFYNQGISDSDFIIIEQYAPENSTLVLEGNAKKNIRELLGDMVDPSRIRTIGSGYYFIGKSKSNSNRSIINKTITVSANGNVFSGCSTSYANADEKPMFNVLDCNGNMWDKIENYCWEHPISIENKKFRETYEAVKLCKQNGIIINGFENYDFNLEELIYTLAISNERIARTLHHTYKALSPQDIIGLSLMVQCLNLLESENTDKDVVKDILKQYIKATTDIKEDEKLKVFLDIESLKILIENVTKLNTILEK